MNTIKNFLIFFFCSVVLTLFSVINIDASGTGTIRYVADNGTDNSSQTCDNSSFPCRTIKAAIDNASNGDTVIIIQGDNSIFYEDNITIDKWVIIQSEGIPLNCQTGLSNLFNIESDNVTIKNISLTCDNLTNTYLIEINGTSINNIVLDNVTIHTNKNGIFANYNSLGSGFEIDNSTITINAITTGIYAIYLTSGMNPKFHNNHFIGGGVNLTNTSITAPEFYNNHFDNISEFGINFMSDNTTIDNNFFTNVGNCVYAYSSSATPHNIKVINSTFDNCSIAAIDLKNVTNNISTYKIYNNIIKKSWYGINIVNSANIVVSDNQILDNVNKNRDISVENSDNITIKNNSIASCSVFSLYFDNLSNSNIENNDVGSKTETYNLDNVTFDGNTFKAGFKIESNAKSDNVTISNNTFYNYTSDNITFLDIRGNATTIHQHIEISNNTFKEPDNGTNTFIENIIYFEYVDNSYVYDNTIDNVDTGSNKIDNGIYLKNGHYNWIKHNTFNDNVTGQCITLINSEFNVLTDNNVSSNAIKLDNASYNTLHNNKTLLSFHGDIEFDNNSNYNIIAKNELEGSIIFSGDSDNNSIYFNKFNDFRDNNSNNDYGQDNYWDSPVKIAFDYECSIGLDIPIVKSYFGNWYHDNDSSFDDTDANDDGIADNPFTVDTISSNDVDQAPFAANNINCYTIYAWWLNIDDNNSYRMTMANLGLRPDNVTINNGDNITFVANNTSNMTFQAGDITDNTTWTGVLTFAETVSDNIYISVGIEDNGTFTSYGSESVSCNAKICKFSKDISSFSTGSNSLALKITNNTGSDIHLLTGGGYSFISKPVDKYKATAEVESGNGNIKINGEIKSEEYFFKNTVLKFEAVPDSGYEFDHYEINSASPYTTNPDNITGTDNFTYSAYFTAINTGGGGSSGGSGSNDSSGDISSEDDTSVDTTTEELNGLAEEADNLIGQGASEEELSGTLDKLSSTIGNLDQVVAAAKDIESINKLSDILDDAVFAGFKLAGNVEGGKEKASDLMEGLGKTISKTIEKTAELASGKELADNVGNIINKVGAVMKNALEAIAELKKSGKSEEVVRAVVEQAQAQLKSISETTTKVISKISGQATEENVSKITSGVGKMVSNVVKTSDNGIGEDVAQSLQKVADETFNAIKNKLLELSSFSGFADSETDLQDLIKNNPLLLEKVIEISAVDLTSGITVDKDTLKDNLSDTIKIYNLTKEQEDELFNSLPEMVNTIKAVISDNGSDNISASTKDILISKFTDMGLKVSGYKTNSSGEMRLGFSNNIKVSVFVSRETIVPSDVPEGLHSMPDGSIVSVKNGISSTLVPAPTNTVNLVSTLIKELSPQSSFSSTDSSDNMSIVQMNKNGTMFIKRKDGKILSMGFGYLFGYEDKFSVGTVSFEMQGLDPASSSYGLLAKYEDNTVQSLPPMVAAFDLLIEEFNRYLGSNYSINRNTGVIDFGYSVKYKPDYELIPLSDLSQSSREWYDKNKDDLGVAFELVDKNHDGIGDIVMYSEYGSQIIYGFKE